MRTRRSLTASANAVATRKATVAPTTQGESARESAPPLRRVRAEICIRICSGLNLRMHLPYGRQSMPPCWRERLPEVNLFYQQNTKILDHQNTFFPSIAVIFRPRS